MEQRKLRAGMVGGGTGAFIGPVHRIALSLDHEAELVAGAFSSNPKKSNESGKKLLLRPDRVYADYREMAKKESALPKEERIDFVSIVTPNNSHYAIAKTFLEAGFHVVCDKPLTTSLKQAKDLRQIVKKTGKVFALMHSYTGYPMVKQARHMVREGVLGKINKVVVEYPQGWMAGFITNPGNAIGMWRMDPKVSGPAGCMGDLGTHCANLVNYITGLEIESICADLGHFVKVNRLEDDGNLLLRFKGGAKGILYASQISAGDENDINIRVYGTKMGLEWHQENPNYLTLKNPAGPKQIYSKGNNYLCKEALEAQRLIWGHPDGLVEAFANIYRAAYKAMRAELAGKKVPACDFPGVDDGVAGLAFVETVLASHRSKSKWTKMKQ